MFSIFNSKAPVQPAYKVSDIPCVIEGINELDVLCPVSKLTGNRENPLHLVNKILPPDKAQLLGGILQEIPPSSNDSRLTDADRFDLVKTRLMTGTPAEDAQWMDYLASVSDVLFPTMEESSTVTEPVSSPSISEPQPE